MKLRRTAFLSLFLCFSLLFAGCAVPGRSPAGDLMAGVRAAEWPASPDAPSRPFSDALTAFSWSILRESAGNDGNILISPASIYLALAMTLNGADTTTRAAMLDALSSTALGVDQLNTASRDWLTRLGRSSASPSLTIANSIWYRTGFNADQYFLQRNADYFAAGARVLDFNKPEAVDTINNWVKDATKGKIEKILEQIGPAAVMYLINTVHFKADWETPFIKNYTAEADFSAPSATVAVPTMHSKGTLDYLELNGAAGMLLPYADRRFAFFAILPPDGQDPRQLIQTAPETFFSEWLLTARAVSVDLALPQFETNYSDSLVNELTSLGMGIAFDSGNADFSLMQAERSKDLFISEVKHKTYMIINEIGTEAAAATLVEISKTSLPDAEVSLAFNRPFLYGILDRESGIPVFIGIMENPAGS